MNQYTAVEERLQQVQERLRKARQQPGAVVYEAGVFNESWLWLGVLFIVLGLVFRQPGLLTLAACLFTVVPVAWLWNRLALRGIRYEREFSVTRAFPGETIEMTVRVTNHKPIPVPWIRISDYLPSALPVREVSLMPAGKDKTTLSTTWALRWFERVTRHYHLFCTQRGRYEIGPAEMTSGDAFALFTSVCEQPASARLIVFPEIYPLSELGLPMQDPFGVAAAHERLFEDPLRTRGVRDWQPDDSLRHVHWKASARHGDLQVRMFEPTADMQLVVFLNVTTLPKHWQGHIPVIFERAISVAASAVKYAADRSWRVGLITNGVARHSDQALRILPSRAPDQLGKILTALAGLTSFPSASIEALLLQESPRLAWGATIVVVTGIVTDELLPALIRLRDAGRRVVLISLALEQPPDLPGIRVYHSGPRLRARGYRREATVEAPEPAAKALADIPSPEPHHPPEGWMLPLDAPVAEESENADGDAQA